MNQGKNIPRGRLGSVRPYVTYTWLAASNQTNQSTRLSSVRRSPNEQWLRAGLFFLPSPLPTLFWPVNLSLRIIFWLAPTLCQFQRPNISHCEIRLLCRLKRNRILSKTFHFFFGLNSSNFHNWSLVLQIIASCHFLDLNVLVLNKPYSTLLSFTVSPGWA